MVKKSRRDLNLLPKFKRDLNIMISKLIRLKKSVKDEHNRLKRLKLRHESRPSYTASSLPSECNGSSSTLPVTSPMRSSPTVKSMSSLSEPPSSPVSSLQVSQGVPPEISKPDEPSVEDTLSQNPSSTSQCPDSSTPADSPNKNEGFTSHFDLNGTANGQPSESSESSSDDEVTIIEGPPRSFIPANRTVSPQSQKCSFPKYFRIQILNLDPYIKYNEVKTVVVDLGIEPKRIVDLLLMNDPDGSVSTVSFDKEHSMITALSYNERITHRGRTLTIRNYDPSWVDFLRGEPLRKVDD